MWTHVVTIQVSYISCVLMHEMLSGCSDAGVMAAHSGLWLVILVDCSLRWLETRAGAWSGILTVLLIWFNFILACLA